jgi:predicted DNA-binding transcriptional regulator AlpA
MSKVTELNDVLLSVKEVANVLTCSESAAYALFNEYGFPGKKVPNVGWRVRKSELFNYINSLSKYGD